MSAVVSKHPLFKDQRPKPRPEPLTTWLVEVPPKPYSSYDWEYERVEARCIGAASGKAAALYGPKARVVGEWTKYAVTHRPGRH